MSGGFVEHGLGKVVFDVSDVVKYAIGNSSVSGIQRVQLRLITEFCRVEQTRDVKVSYFDEEDNVFYVLDPGELFAGDAFDAEGILLRLGKVRRRFFPEKFRIKRYLKKYEDRKIVRGVEKLRVYLAALVARGWLRERGMLSETPVGQTPLANRVPLSGGALSSSDTFVLLGSFWDYAEVLRFAEAHKLSGGKVLALIHDLIPVVAPNYSTAGLSKIFHDFLPWIPRIATKVVAVSRFTAGDVERVLGMPSGSVVALGLAHEMAGFPRGAFVEQGSFAADSGFGDFALCVGTIEIRKNGLMLLKAWQRLIEEGVQDLPDLVFAGKFGWRLSEFKDFLARHEMLQRKVKIVNSPSDQDIGWLYSHARFCLFPSHYEGWGLPVGEAAWFGRYVIASSASSVPEVCGGCMDYVDPDDLAGWCRAIKRAISTDYRSMKEKFIREKSLRTWRDSATMLRSLLD